MDRDALNDNDEEIRGRRVLIFDPYAEVPISLKYLLLYEGEREVKIVKDLQAACDTLKTFAADMVFLGSRSVAVGLIGFFKRIREGILCFLITPENGVGAELDAVCMGADGHVSLPLTFEKLDWLLEKYFDTSEPKDRREATLMQDEDMSPYGTELRLGLMRLAADGSFLWADRNLCDVLGYTKDELCRKRIQEIVHPGERRKLPTEIFSSFFEIKEPAFRARVRLIDRSGSNIFVELVKGQYFTEMRSLNDKESGNWHRP